MEYREILDRLDPEEIKALNPGQRAALNLPKYESVFKNFADNLLPVRSNLRKLFGLQFDYDVYPPYDLDANDGDITSTWSWYDSMLRFENNRQAVYAFVEEASSFDVLASALDLYAEDATQVDPEKGRSYWVTGEDQGIVSELEKMFERIQAEDEIFGWARSAAMYGDCFEQIISTPTEGVVSLEHVNPHQITRIQDRFGRLQGFAGGLIPEEQLQRMKRDPNAAKGLKVSNPWDFLHFRLVGSNRVSSHGSSMLLSARHCWRQLKIVEDSLVLYRVQRAPDRTVYYIETDGQSVEDKFRTAHQWRRHLRKRMYWNPQTGGFRQEYHPWAIDQDIYMPINRGSETKIERQPAGTDLGDIYDVDHLVNKLFSALRIPKAYMGWEGDVNAKATLCLTGDTVIPLLDGSYPTIRELAEGDRDEFWLYSATSDGKVVPGRGHSARLTKRNAELIELTLDNGESVRCTLDHPIMMRDGTYQEADFVLPGDSLMPLYTREVRRGNHSTYRQVKHPSGVWQMAHVAVDRYLNGSIGNGQVVHHADFDSLNNDPSNLVRMDRSEHMELHVTNGRSNLLKYLKSDQNRKNVSKQLKGLWEDPEWARRQRMRACAVGGSHPMPEHMKQMHSKRWRRDGNPRYRRDLSAEQILQAAPDHESLKSLSNAISLDRRAIRRILAEAGIEWKGFLQAHGFTKGRFQKSTACNHQVVEVRYLEHREDTYDLTVDQHHNFAIGAGVFVHNSMQDIRFARGVKRLQRAILQGMTLLAEIHLAKVKGYRRKEGSRPFQIHLAPISYLDSLQRSELYRIQIELAEAAHRVLKPLIFPNADPQGGFGGGDQQMSGEDRAKAEVLALYVMRKYLGMPKEEIEVLVKGVDFDTALDKDSDDDSWVGRPQSPDALNSSMKQAANNLEDSLSESIRRKLDMVQNAATVLRDDAPLQIKDPLPDDKWLREHKDEVELFLLDEEVRRPGHQFEQSECPVCTRTDSVRLYERGGKEYLVCIREGCSFAAEVSEDTRREEKAASQSGQ